MNENEAVKELELLKAAVEWEYPLDYQILFDYAISAIEKQKPKRPYTHVIPYPYMPDATVVQCPACKRRLRTRRTTSRGDEYCPSCGQHIDWEGIDG